MAEAHLAVARHCSTRTPTCRRSAHFLDNRLVLNYRNGSDWYDVHPLLREVVDAHVHIAALDADTERIAVNLLRFLEWQETGFSLLFLFADFGPSLQMADWLDERLALERATLQRQAVPPTFADEPELFVDATGGRLAELSRRPGGVMLPLQRHPHDARGTAHAVCSSRA